ncbi:tetrapyrrole-binding protein, chloroplastic-like, partial [Salvia splendens]|uniref:tetrapyrrole-binding protein, chloroplastic-like n=1 Tax=Salvia splendens TaxID=180675 RepID=UPI001C26452C
LDLLRQHLVGKDPRQADEQTRCLNITLAAVAAVKRGYVFFSKVQFIPAEALREIDALWRQHNDGKFGYYVQQRIWKKLNGDFKTFFIKVGWMKKLESSEVEQYNYRSFPAEFMWEMEEGPPEGHLLLTNALRGTQLLSCILGHPAFDEEDDVLTVIYRQNK